MSGAGSGSKGSSRASSTGGSKSAGSPKPSGASRSKGASKSTGASKPTGGPEPKAGAGYDPPRRRRPGPPPLLLSVILLIVALSVFFVVLLRDGSWDLRPRLLQREQRSGSVATFEEIRELGRLETLAYVRRSVFPHDFLQPHLTVTGLLRTIGAAGTTAAEALDPTELTHLRAANLASSVQLATTRSDDRFVVVTTTLVFGYDLDALVTELEAAQEITAGDPGETIVFTLPRPQLLTVLTENINRANYPFPAVFLDAEGWRRVTSFVEDHVVVTAPMNELLRTAAENGLTSLRTLLDPERNRFDLRLPEETAFDLFFH